MADYSALKQTIDNNIKTNGNQEITGSVLNSVLNAMVNTLGAGYQYAGVATPSSNPGTPDTNVFYIAATAGTYTNMGGLVVSDGEVAILKYNGTWTKDVPGVATAAQVTKLDQKVDEKTGDLKMGKTISSANPASLISGVNIPAGTKLKIKISSASAVWSRLALFGNSTAWASRTWTADNIQNGVEYEFIPAVDITGISVYPIDVSSYGDLDIEISYDPQFISGKLDKSSLVQELGLDANNIISQKVVSQNLYRLFASVVPRDLGKNKYVPTFIESGYFFTQTGKSASSSHNLHYYIQIAGNTQYRISGFLNAVPESSYAIGSGNVFIQFLDENFEILSAIAANTRTFTTPANAKYMNVSVSATLDKYQLELGDTTTTYEEPIFGNTKYQELLSMIQAGNPDFSIAIKKLDFAYSKNLIDLNAEDFAAGKIIANSYGRLDSNASYNTTNFCRVTPGGKYFFSRGDTMAAVSARFLLYYDENKQPITSSYATSQSSPLTAPDGAYYVRLTYQIAINPLPQLESGEFPTEYQAYNLVIPQSKIQRVATPSASFGSFRDSDTLAASEVLTLPSVHVQKNVLLAAVVTGTISTLRIGVGYMSTSPYRGYNSRWLEITGTEVKLYGKYNDSPVLYNTFEHALTLGTKTFIAIESTLTESGMSTKLSIRTEKGDQYTQTITNMEWGVGQPFVENGGSSSLDVELSFMLRDITKRVWIFGDSYISFSSDARWAYYATGDGNIRYLSNNQPGLEPATAVDDLRNILTLEYKPTYLIWMLGMNGDGTETQEGGVYVINSYQKNNIDAVVGICESNGIIPIFTCIPTVPSYQKTGFCNYIRSLGYRYIDVAEAVGTNENGEWADGLLSSDNVHPTSAGAKVIYGQILTDAPEIGIQE